MRIQFGRRGSYTFLCFSPLLMATVWSTHALGASAAVRYGSAGVLILAMLTATWILGGQALVTGEPERRQLALAGSLLVAVWSSLVFIGVLGPPHQATISENALRYVILLADAIAIAAALMILRDVLRDAGERFYSTLGFSAAVLAWPPYVIFTIVQQLEYRALERGTEPAQLGSTVEFVETLSLGMLLVGALLMYLATAAFASALRSRRWLRQKTAGVYIGLALFAAACVAARMAEALLTKDGPIFGFKHWYAVPGFALVIPAVPWILPGLLGIGLLRRASEELR